MASDWNPPVVGTTTVKVETLAEMHARHAAEMARLTRPGAPTYAQLEARLAEAGRLLRGLTRATSAYSAAHKADRCLCATCDLTRTALHDAARWLEGGAHRARRSPKGGQP